MIGISFCNLDRFWAETGKTYIEIDGSESGCRSTG
jgi:hypothetical protein